MDANLDHIKNSIDYLEDIGNIFFELSEDPSILFEEDQEEDPYEFNTEEKDESEDSGDSEKEDNENYTLYDFNMPEEADDDNPYDNLEWDFYELSESIFRFLKYFNEGYQVKFGTEFSNICSYLNYEPVVEQFSKINIDSEKFINNITLLIDSINKNEFYTSTNIEIPPLIKEINDEMLFQFSRYPELIYKIEPRLFEELIAKIFSKHRIDVSLTKKTRDGGYDIVAIEDNIFTKNQYIIECKRYDKHNKVDISIVQRLYGVKCALQNITKALLVTSSFYTKDALAFAKQHMWELELKDFNDIQSWLKEYWH